MPLSYSTKTQIVRLRPMRRHTLSTVVMASVPKSIFELFGAFWSVLGHRFVVLFFRLDFVGSYFSEFPCYHFVSTSMVDRPPLRMCTDSFQLKNSKQKPLQFRRFITGDVKMAFLFSIFNPFTHTHIHTDRHTDTHHPQSNPKALAEVDPLEKQQNVSRPLLAFNVYRRLCLLQRVEHLHKVLEYITTNSNYCCWMSGWTHQSQSCFVYVVETGLCLLKAGIRDVFACITKRRFLGACALLCHI
jgi:hypothetical protein